MNPKKAASILGKSKSPKKAKAARINGHAPKRKSAVQQHATEPQEANEAVGVHGTKNPAEAG